MLRKQFFARTALFVVSLLFLGNCPAASASEPPARVAVLPFAMHAPSNLGYLQEGIRDMLTSRLAWQGKVQVIDRAATDQALRGTKADQSGDEAVRIGKALKADHVLFGSVTAIGQSVSIDARMVPVAGGGEPVALATQARSMDDVIPQINAFAQQINAKIFGRPTEGGASAQMAEAEALNNRNPELLIPGMISSSDRISYLNPNFIELTPEGSLRQPGLWKSQVFQGGIVGIDVGDIDGDGREELVMVTRDKVMAYRKEAHGLKPIGSFGGTNVDRFLNVAVVDVARDRTAKIFVTNLAKQNKSRPEVSDTGQGEAGHNDAVGSFALQFVNGRLERVSEPCSFFLNAVELPGRGKVLIGQEKGRSTEGPFKGGIYEMQVRGREIVPSVALGLPDRCNVFNFAKADINGDHSDEIILIAPSSQLMVMNSGGDVLWRGDNVFGSTTNTFEGKVEDRRYNHVDLFAIPAPIVVTDLNKDNIPEVIVTRSLDKLAKFLPNSLKYFDRGEIVSLSWDNMGMVENWKTREISGMITSVRTGDLNKDGTTELVASLVLAKDFLKFWDSQSSVFSYDLNVSPTKTAAKK